MISMFHFLRNICLIFLFAVHVIIFLINILLFSTKCCSMLGYKYDKQFTHEILQVVKYSYSKGGNFCSNAQKNDILIKTLGGDSYFNNQKLVMPFSCQPQHSFIFIGTYCHPEGQAKANAQPGWLNIHTKETNP